MAKTSNCVIIKHVPTGVQVRCHATRSREANRRIARKELQLRLDELHRGADSIRAQKECVQRNAVWLRVALAHHVYSRIIIDLIMIRQSLHPPLRCRAREQKRAHRAASKSRSKHAHLAELKRIMQEGETRERAPPLAPGDGAQIIKSARPAINNNGGEGAAAADEAGLPRLEESNDVEIADSVCLPVVAHLKIILL